MFLGFNFKKTRGLLFSRLLAVAMLLWSGIASAQLADLDLLEDNDRSFGLSVTRAPDPTTNTDTESRSAILLVPLHIKQLYFEGGFGSYFTQSIAEGTSAASLQWRVQGGPHFGKFGFQFYVEGVWKQGIDYAGFIRVGEFDLGRVLVSGGLGTLVRADTETELATGIERNAAAGGDTKVKGLLLVSGEVDTEMFESLRLLGTVMPGFDGEHDYVGEFQVKYALEKINLAGLGRFGWERNTFTKRYTGLVQIPF